MHTRLVKTYWSTITLMLLLFTDTTGQNAVIKGYAFEDQNRGYLNMARIIVRDTITKTVFLDTYTNIEGYFYGNVPGGIPIVVEIQKDMFEPQRKKYTLEPNQTENISFKMVRLPGYVFELTLAEKKLNIDTPSKAINGAQIEMYNNTTRTAVVDLINPSHEFKLNFIKGNHYTILIRKPGYLAKRLEAFVNVNGCILCFEGVGEVRPGVVDNLSGNNSIGVLLANVELDNAEVGRTISLGNIQYELGSADLKKESYAELDKLATIALNNSSLSLEIGSHTDSRGGSDANFALSSARSKSVVNYLVDKWNISRKQLVPVGYGEAKLVNNCADGILCSEIEHQLNRRTALKILGRDQDYVEKSLKVIKTIEEFDADLLNNKIKTYKVDEVQKVDTDIEIIGQTNAGKIDKIDSIIVDEKPKDIAKIPVNKVEEVKAVIEAEDDSKTTIMAIDEFAIPNEESRIEPKKELEIKEYKVIAGTFKHRVNAQKIIDKLYLIGYPQAFIVEENAAYVIVAGNFEKLTDANETSNHISKNGIETKIEELKQASKP